MKSQYKRFFEAHLDTGRYLDTDIRYLDTGIGKNNTDVLTHPVSIMRKSVKKLPGKFAIGNKKHNHAPVPLTAQRMKLLF